MLKLLFESKIFKATTIFFFIMVCVIPAMALDLYEYDLDFSLKDKDGILKDEFSLKNEHLSTHPYDTDIYWRTGSGREWYDGFWGFVYNQDGDKSELQPYFHIHMQVRNRRFRSIRGPFYEGGPSYTTLIGYDLGANYSPYVAALHNRILGIRIMSPEYDLIKIGKFQIDGTYIFGYLDSNIIWDPTNVAGWDPELYSGDIALNVKGNIKSLMLNSTILTYHKFLDSQNENRINYYNYGINGKVDVIPKRIGVETDYARYQENNDWFYQVKTEWQVWPGRLKLYNVSRDSQFKDLDVIKGPKKHYIANDLDLFADTTVDEDEVRDFLEDMNEYGRSFNTGLVFSFDAFTAQNQLTLDYASKAPPYTPECLDPRQLIGLETNYFNFKIKQNLYTLSPQDRNEKTRMFYRLAIVARPDFELPFSLNGTIRFDFDYDNRYSKDSIEGNETIRNALAGLQLSTTRDIWRLKRVRLDSVFLVGRDGEGDDWETDPFKYAFMLRYTAPNYIQFRIQYFSSHLFKDPPTDVYGRDRYKPYRWYRNDSKVDGWRFIVGIPF